MAKKGYILMENGEKIEFDLFPNEAPNTVANFENLANTGFYDGVTFHRVIPGFVSQGGDPTGTGMGGSEKQLNVRQRATLISMKQAAYLWHMQEKIQAQASSLLYMSHSLT